MCSTIGRREMAMTTMTASIEAQGGARMGGGNRSRWHEFWAAVLEPPARNLEGEIVEYLQCHRHDLPPEIYIELERRDCGP
jgi:hypothetical protein